jgi:hypothetical protein
MLLQRGCRLRNGAKAHRNTPERTSKKMPLSHSRTRLRSLQGDLTGAEGEVNVDVQHFGFFGMRILTSSSDKLRVVERVCRAHHSSHCPDRNVRLPVILADDAFEHFIVSRFQVLGEFS